MTYPTSAVTWLLLFASVLPTAGCGSLTGDCDAGDFVVVADLSEEETMEYENMPCKDICVELFHRDAPEGFVFVHPQECEFELLAGGQARLECSGELANECD